MSDGVETIRIVSDEEFERQLRLLRQTRQFLIEQGVLLPAEAIGGESPLSLGRLNLIRFRVRLFRTVSHRAGNTPTLADWTLLEQKQTGLNHLFDADLQRRFRLRTTRRIITVVPLVLLLIALFSLVLAVFPPGWSLFGTVGPDVSKPIWMFVSYLVWTSCLGGLGAAAFLAVNSLAIQHDVTFDLSDLGLVLMRIVIGALFGCMVSLPFCFPYFKVFTRWVLDGLGELDPSQGVLLLVPFLLGFSTTVVMAVLNRMISGIETVFGLAQGTARSGDRPGGSVDTSVNAGRTPISPTSGSAVVRHLSVGTDGASSRST